MGYARVSCFSNLGELDVFNGWRGEVGCARVGWFPMGGGRVFSVGDGVGRDTLWLGAFHMVGVYIHTKEKKGFSNDNELLASAICSCDLDQQIDATLT